MPFIVCPTLHAQTNSYIDSTRPGISSDAAIQQKGVLQVESGYDGYFKGYNQTVGTSFYYALTNWLRLDAALNEVASEDDKADLRRTGLGTSSFGAKAVLFHDGRSKTIPGFALEYGETLATASEHALQSRSHQGTLIVSNSYSKWRWRVNGSAIGAGCDTADRCSVHGQGAAGVSYAYSHATTLSAEVFGQTTAAGAPVGAYTFGGFSHKWNQRAEVNGGLRFGLTPVSSTIGVTVGLTFGVGKAPLE